MKDSVICDCVGDAMGGHDHRCALRKPHPVLTWFDCSRCGHAFHIGAFHREAVEAHHRKLAHTGDMTAILEERE